MTERLKLVELCSSLETTLTQVKVALGRELVTTPEDFEITLQYLSPD